MRRVAIDELKAGDRLGRDVYVGAEMLPLLRAGIRISDSYRMSLERAGITSVWVDDAFSDGIEPLEVLEDSTKRRATAAIHDAFKNVSASPKNGATMSIGMRVMRRFGWVDAVGKVRFDQIEDRLVPLGVGLLHDVGKLAIPAEILRKPGPLSDDEWKAIRSHPMLGVDILKKAEGVSPLARAVVRSHRERWDGSGYPEKKAGAAIHQFARIAAAADVFDALTSERCYRAALAPHEGYDFVLGRAGKDFDPDVVDIFKSFVAPYPPGTRVVLSDGNCGLVKEVRQDAVTLPIVRIIMDASGAVVVPWEVDLAKSPELKIVATHFEVPECTPA